VPEFTTGLTRIRPQVEPQSNSFIQPASDGRNPQVIKALAIKKEIEQLERIHKGLQDSIEELHNERNRGVKQISVELNVLKKQKSLFLEEIKTIGKMLSVLEDAKNKGQVVFDGFFRNRENILVNFSSAVNKKIAGKVKILDERATSLVKEEDLLVEMTDYTTSFLSEAYRALHEVGEAKLSLKIDSKKLVDEKRSLKAISEKTIAEAESAKRMYSNAISNLKRTTEIKNNAEAYADKISTEADERAKIVDLKALKVLEKEEYFKTWEQKLKNFEIKLTDKENTLKRAFEELRRRNQPAQVV